MRVNNPYSDRSELQTLALQIDCTHVLSEHVLERVPNDGFHFIHIENKQVIFHLK